MSQQRGFTLLELMVVLAIIGALLGVATLSVGNHHARDETLAFTRQLTLIMGAAQEEAVFQNVDLGFAIDVDALQLLQYQDVQSQEFSANKSLEELARLESNPWQPYQGRALNAQITAPEGIFMALSLDGQDIDFSDLLNQERGPLPALLFLSNDEYTPFELTLQHTDDSLFAIVIQGDGMNIPRWELIQYEF